LLRLVVSIDSDNSDLEALIPLLEVVLNNQSDEAIWNKVYDTITESTPPPRLLPVVQQTPWLRNTSSFANSSEHRKHVDEVLKDELGQMYVGVPGFFEAYFGGIECLELAAKTVLENCKKGDKPIYGKDTGWRGWPSGAKESDVLGWFAELITQLPELSEEYRLLFKTSRRLLTRPNQPIQGSTAERKLDIGFVDDPSAGRDSICHWSQILVPGELKSNPSADIASKAWLDLGTYAREVLAAQDTRRFVLGFTLCGSLMRLWLFDRLGGIGSTRFDINEHGLQFVSVILGFLWMDEAQLGFDPTIFSTGAIRYIEIERNGQKERLIIDQLIKRAPCVAGRATTCWKAHRDGDDSRIPLVIKDSWQYPEREEEGELLREATSRDVVNVARYYYHETVCVGEKEDDIQSNVRKGLDIRKAVNYKAGNPLARDEVRTTRKGQSSSTSQKRSSSQTNAPMPPSKRSCSRSPTKIGRSNASQNRIHRRVVIRDYGKSIYKASSRAALLAALEGCIEGYESLHIKAGMLQCDISPRNLMMNEEVDNPSWRSFLIDLDLAIKEQREGFSGARGKTGTRAFMAIGVLLGEKHSFMHDLESFFWVLFWICIHYERQSQGRIVPYFEEWNYMGTVALATAKKGEVIDEGDFLKNAEENFTSYYQPLIPWVNKLRKVVFPGGIRLKIADTRLYLNMKQVLQAAQKDPKVLAE